MLYFNTKLVSVAYNIMEAKGVQDDAKAYEYVTEIDCIIEHFEQGGGYNSIYAEALDRRIREDYPLIKNLENPPSNDSMMQSNATSTDLPTELSYLITDKFGILYTVLLKKGIVSTVKDFLK